MSRDVVRKLEGVVKTEVLTEKNGLTELLKDNKIIVSILKGPEVSAKVIKIVKTPPKKQPALSEKEIQAIKAAKKALANNAGAIYLLTLLARAKEVASQLDIQSLSPEGAELMKLATEDAISNMAVVVRKIVEHKKEKPDEKK